MVLRGRPRGRVGHRRTSLPEKPTPTGAGFSALRRENPSQSQRRHVKVKGSKAARGVGPGRGGRFLATLLRKVARESPHDPALPTTMESPTPTSWEAQPRPEPEPGPPPLRVHPHRPRLNTPFAAPMAAPYRCPHHGSYLWWWGPGPLSKPPGGGGIRTLRPPLHVFAFAMARRCSSSCRSCARRIARSQLASLGGSFMGSC
jgi:hypothetical protein